MGSRRDVYEGDPVKGKGEMCLAGCLGDGIRRRRVKQETEVRGRGGNVFSGGLGEEKGRRCVWRVLQVRGDMGRSKGAYALEDQLCHAEERDVHAQCFRS